MIADPRMRLKKMVAVTEKVKFNKDCSEIREWAFSTSTLACD